MDVDGVRSPTISHESFLCCALSIFCRLMEDRRSFQGMGRDLYDSMGKPAVSCCGLAWPLRPLSITLMPLPSAAEGVQGAAAVVVFMSQAYSHSENCKLEVQEPRSPHTTADARRGCVLIGDSRRWRSASLRCSAPGRWSRSVCILLRFRCVPTVCNTPCGPAAFSKRRDGR
jgi:hypothetical protein